MVWGIVFLAFFGVLAVGIRLCLCEQAVKKVLTASGIQQVSLEHILSSRSPDSVEYSAGYVNYNWCGIQNGGVVKGFANYGPSGVVRFWVEGN